MSALWYQDHFYEENKIILEGKNFSQSSWIQGAPTLLGPTISGSALERIHYHRNTPLGAQ
jgi:hypothetical protein